MAQNGPKWPEKGQFSHIFGEKWKISRKKSNIFLKKSNILSPSQKKSKHFSKKYNILSKVLFELENNVTFFREKENIFSHIHFEKYNISTGPVWAEKDNIWTEKDNISSSPDLPIVLHIHL